LERSIVKHIHSEEFFHQKAIGWSLREYSKTDSKWVIDFVNKYKLKPLSEREALKHIKK
jgi:3-methyladenine DNA glycosylase AlkD